MGNPEILFRGDFWPTDGDFTQIYDLKQSILVKVV